jgi:hypothetical protein
VGSGVAVGAGVDEGRGVVNDAAGGDANGEAVGGSTAVDDSSSDRVNAKTAIATMATETAATPAMICQRFNVKVITTSTSDRPGWWSLLGCHRCHREAPRQSNTPVRVIDVASLPEAPAGNTNSGRFGKIAVIGRSH